MSSTASHICSQDLPHQLGDMEGDMSQGEMLSSWTQTNPPNTTGRFKGSQEKVKHSPSASGGLCMSHVIQHQHPQGKWWLSGKLLFRIETTEWVGRRVRFTLLGEKINIINKRPDQLKSIASFKRHSALPRAKAQLSSREQGMNPDVHIVPNYTLRVLPDTQAACRHDCCLPLLCGLLIHGYV